MGRFFIHLAYNGANYHGWQTQLVATKVERTVIKQPGLPTVQQTLEQALGTLLRQPVAVVGCGRTDTGVHASDFYAHFDYRGQESMDCGQLVFKLNNLLPPDIAIFDIFPVADNAHARFDAVARTYQYHVSDRRLPFRQGQYCRIYFKPDIDKMNEAARVLMDACLEYGAERFHQVGTDEVYGDLPLDRPDLFFHEDTPLKTSSP